MATNRVEVQINSRQYVVLAEESEEYIKKLAEHIDQKVNMVLKGGQNILGERPIVLAALNICDEYYKCIEAGKVLEDQVKLANEKLIKANSEINRLKTISPQITIDEQETEKKLAEAEHKIKLLEARLNELGTAKNDNPNTNQVSRQQDQNGYNNSYNRYSNNGRRN